MGQPAHPLPQECSRVRSPSREPQPVDRDPGHDAVPRNHVKDDVREPQRRGDADDLGLRGATPRRRSPRRPPGSRARRRRRDSRGNRKPKGESARHVAIEAADSGEYRLYPSWKAFRLARNPSSSRSSAGRTAHPDGGVAPSIAASWTTPITRSKRWVAQLSIVRCDATLPGWVPA